MENKENREDKKYTMEGHEITKIEDVLIMINQEELHVDDKLESYKHMIDELLRQMNENAALYFPEKKLKKFKVIEIDDNGQPILQDDVIDGTLILADKQLLIKKVMFYREQTDKLRQYISDNKIGEPCQNLFDIIYNHIQSIETANARLQKENEELINGTHHT